jgi:diguanylate cyclase (GGDEF)-like protein
MRARRGATATAGSRLFLIYAVASLVPVLLLGLVLSRGARQDALDRALDQGKAQAAVIEQMAIAPVLGRHVLRNSLRGAELQSLLDATELASFSGSVVRVRLRSFSGGIVFSDDGRTDGALPATSAAFRKAASGGKDVAIVADPTGGADRLIRVLQPIVPNASGQATGVLEVYLPYKAIAAKAQDQLHRTYVRMGAALAGLYLVLAMISWSTTRRLRRHAAARERQALHDPLTGLPNREWFRLRAERMLAAEEPGAIVLADLDRFKEVNDSLGHHAGDELLRVVARRLSESVRTDDAVARLGGDEFGLILPNVSDARDAADLLARVRDELSAELTLDGVRVGVEASFGVALHPEHGTTLEELLKRADAAMYRGKRGAASIVVYADESAPATPSSLVMQSELRRALERDELVLHYQPKIALDSGRPCGVEALLRWQHPERGLLGPGEFLPVVERSGLIEPVTAWVLEHALEDRDRWLAAGAGWPLSVNVSARNLESPGFLELVLRLLADGRTSPSELRLEVTETALAADAAVAARTLRALASRGVTLSIDDFGTGYTCLAQLRTLPVAEIKIDRAFVAGLDERGEDRSIVQSLIELGHGLGCAVVAEGVETRGTAAWLRAASCDAAQGYHYARPAPWPELLDRWTDPAPALGSTTTT